MKASGAARSLVLLMLALIRYEIVWADELDGSRKRPSTADEIGLEPRIIVKLRSSDARRGRPRAESDTLASLASRAGFKARRVSPLGARLHVLELEAQSRDQSIDVALERVNADFEVEFAALDRRRYLHAAPDDFLYAAQWYLQTGSVAPSAIDAERAWDISTGSGDIVVAFLDTGVLYDHPDLQSAGVGGRLLPGYDFVSTVVVANDGDGRDADATDPGDWVTAEDRESSVLAACQQTTSSWHGTRVAGIIGARSNNGIGIAGTTWQPWLLPVRVIGKCGGLDSDILPAMLWAAGIHVDGVPDNPYPAQVLNLSLGAEGSCSPAYRDVIDAITARGAIVVVSAGNSGGPVDSPANCTGVVGVAGLRHTGTKVGYSSLGRQVAISAPAGNCVNLTGACLFSIVTATNGGTTVPTTHSYSDQLSYNVGTSFSAPIVAGIVALMASANGNLDTARLIERLQEGATKPFPVSSDAEVPQCHVPLGRGDIQSSECNCTTSTCGAGMANASRALEAALRPIAEVASDSVFSPGGIVTLSGLNSLAAAGRSIVDYDWSLECGYGNFTPVNLADAVVEVPASGSFTLRLTITDDAGRTDRADVVITPAAATRTPGTAGSDGCVPIALSLSPSATVVQTRAERAFTVAVENAGDQSVTWYVDGAVGGNATIGTISTAGVYTAPATVPSPATVTVTAASNEDPTRTGSASVTIVATVASTVVPMSSGGGGAIDGASLLVLFLTILGARSARCVRPPLSPDRPRPRLQPCSRYGGSQFAISRYPTPRTVRIGVLPRWSVPSLRRKRLM